ncbi:MAG TPA: RNA 2',3'-cyclic phosphodiesterase [Pyrinomonadaceae bacterium]|nr:RNA 2',3'-cyclic phosphodiesterase [Pyrinomonadaceae bacterium]
MDKIRAGISVDTFRTFIAIELPADVRARAAQHIARLRHELPDVRASWSREDNLHLTLKFLGNVSVDDIPRVSDSVAIATKSAPSFELTFSDCGVFPSHGRPSVLWLGAGSAGILPASSVQIPSSSELDRLYSSIENELVVAGFPLESRPFRPHLTIARLRHPRGARHLAELHKSLGFAPIQFSVSEVVVFKSELFKDGSKHTAISRHELA